MAINENFLFFIHNKGKKPKIKKSDKNVRLFYQFKNFQFSLHCAVDLTAAEAPGTDVNMAWGAVYYCLNSLHIRSPCTIGTSMGVADLNTKGNALVTKFTLGHLLHLLALINDMLF